MNTVIMHTVEGVIVSINTHLGRVLALAVAALAARPLGPLPGG